LGAVEDFDDVGVGKDLVQLLDVVSQGEEVDDVVVCACADLHETEETEVGAVAVVLEVYGELCDGGERLEHGLEGLWSGDPGEGSERERGRLGGGGRGAEVGGVGYVVDFVVVGMGFRGVQGDFCVVFVGEGRVPGCVAVVWFALEGELGLWEMGGVVDDRILGFGGTEGLVEAGILVIMRDERDE